MTDGLEDCLYDQGSKDSNVFGGDIDGLPLPSSTTPIGPVPRGSASAKTVGIVKIPPSYNATPNTLIPVSK